jgi:hypothetical protein
VLIDPAWQPEQSGLEYARKVGVADVVREVRNFVRWHIEEQKPRARFDWAWEKWCDRANTAPGNRSTQQTGNGGGLMGAANRAVKRATPFQGVTIDAETE